MKLYERLPDSIVFNGKKVKLNLDFRNVLRMIDILSRDDLTPDAREYLALKCICKRPKNGMMFPVRRLLFPNKGTGEKLTDLDQDADLIRAAFLQTYGINLYRDKLNWFEFSCLLSSIPSGTRYADIIGIRAKPIPAPNKYNAEERERLLKAKAEFSLHNEHFDYSESVGNVAKFLLSLGGE